MLFQRSTLNIILISYLSWHNFNDIISKVEASISLKGFWVNKYINCKSCNSKALLFLTKFNLIYRHAETIFKEQLAVLNKAKIFELRVSSCLKSMLSIHTLFGILGTCKLLLCLSTGWDFHFHDYFNLHSIFIAVLILQDSKTILLEVIQKT